MPVSIPRIGPLKPRGASWSIDRRSLSARLGVRALLVVNVYPPLLDVKDGLGIGKMVIDLLGKNQCMLGSGAIDTTSALSV